MAIRATGQRILVEQYEISRWVRTQRFTESIAEHDVTGMNQLAREFVPGFPDAGGELSGHLDHAINASGSTLKGMLGTPDRIWTVAYDTFAPGKDVDMALAALTAFRPSWSVQAPAGLAGSLIVNGAIEGGRSLQDLQAL